jgi:transposase-like protein
VRYYPEEFKSKMVEKMARPGGPSATSLSHETGVPQTTLSRWLRRAGKVEGMRQKSKRPQDWTAQEKLEAVIEAEGLSEEELGAFLRRQGLHRAHLERWRAAMRSALDGPAKRKRPGKSPEARKVRELEKELQRKEKALAEASALLVLKKKAQAIWGDEDDDTGPRSGK